MGNIKCHHKIGLTPRQREAFDYIKSFMGKTGVCPSYQKIADVMGLKSKGNVSVLISALIERGYLGRNLTKGSARSLSIITSSCPNCGYNLD